MTVNKVIVLGYVGQDPEIKYAPVSGDAIVTLSIGTSEKYKDKKTEELKSDTEWHKVVFFGKTAEIAGKFLKKGSSVYIEGKIKTRKWQDKEGKDRYTTEIIGSMLDLQGGKKRDNQEHTKNVDIKNYVIDDDDIPF